MVINCEGCVLAESNCVLQYMIVCNRRLWNMIILKKRSVGAAFPAGATVPKNSYSTVIWEVK